MLAALDLHHLTIQGQGVLWTGSQGRADS